jgi:hypothetical protein
MVDVEEGSVGVEDAEVAVPTRDETAASLKWKRYQNYYLNIVSKMF